MKKISKVRIITNVLLVLVFVLGLGSFSNPAKASVSQQDPDGFITSDQEGVQVSATRAWTKAEMLAAKPYPLGEGTGDATPTVDVLAGPDGLPGKVAGAAPVQSPAANSLSAAVEITAGMDFLGYSYPPPFTRQYVASIGNDTMYPLSTIGKLFFTQLGVAYVCSASVVAKNGILTTGHCAHAGNGLYSGWSTNVVFVPAYKNGYAPYGQWTTNLTMVPSRWYYYAEPRMDYGAMRVRQQSAVSIGTRVGYLGYAWNFSRVQAWWAIGYPQAAPFAGKYMTACQSSYAYDEAYGSTSYPALMTIGCDQTGGTSGGPWVKNFGSSNYVNGINAYRHTSQPLELSGPYFNSTTGSFLDTVRAW